MKLQRIVMIVLFLGHFAFANDPDVCSFYLEKSAELGCSSENYLTRFGLKYCERFLKKEKLFSSFGKTVLNGIRNCLIDELKIAEGLTCENVKMAAQEMHIRCYAENHFCDLSSQDQNTAFWIVKSEVSDPIFLKTLLQIRHSCLK